MGLLKFEISLVSIKAAEGKRERREEKEKGPKVFVEEKRNTVTS